jgi:hypothetical protein
VSKKNQNELGTYPHLTLARARALRDEYLSCLPMALIPQVHNNDKANALKNATEHTSSRGKEMVDEKVKLRYLTRPCNDIWRSLERNIFPAWVMFHQ